MEASFEFQTATRIVFGPGKASVALDWIAELGARRVLLVTGRNGERSRALRAALHAQGVTLESLTVAAEPSVELVREGASHAREQRIEAVLAVGGGSAIDAGKAIAVLATHEGDPLDYLEVVGRGMPLVHPSLPFAALPTTAGTGAEVTRNAVLGSRAHGVKASLRSPLMLPRLAVVDPELLSEAPPEVLRASGLDALSQLIEPFVSVRSQPFSDALAREGLARSRRSLERAVREGAGEEERTDLALASLFGGLCLANAGLGAVHGLAAPLGGLLEAPHGAICAALLPQVMAVNIEALRAREPEGARLARFGELASLLTGTPDADPEQGAHWIERLCRRLAVPGLARYGLLPTHIPELVARARTASSMRGNPITLTEDELTRVVEAAL